MPNLSDFEKTLKELLDTKVTTPVRYMGVLGIYRDGQNVVQVPNRPNFVYVRLNNSDTEIIQAYNKDVAPNFGLAVVVERRADENFYRVVDVQVNNYGENPIRRNYLPKHGPRHAYGYSPSTKGIDPVWLYKRQLIQPLGALPSDENMKVMVYGDYYNWNGEIKFFPNTKSIDLSIYKPTGGNNSRFVTIYVDGNTNQLGYVVGDEFLNNFYSTGIISYIPEVSPNLGIQTAAILLSTGTSNLDFDDVRDIRSFLDNASSYISVHPLDPIYGYHSGTLRATVVSIEDSGNFYSSTNVEGALQEIGQSIKDLQDEDDPSQHQHGLARWAVESGTTYLSLPDVAEYVDNLFVNGQLLDPLYYTLATGGFGIHLQYPINLHSSIIVCNYVIRSIS